MLNEATARESRVNNSSVSQILSGNDGGWQESPLVTMASVIASRQGAQTHCFKASVILFRAGEDAFDIIVRRSFADYFCRMPLDAAESEAA